jgi:hypothetical protein
MLFSLAAHSPIVSWPRLAPQLLPLKLFGTAHGRKNIWCGVRALALIITPNPHSAPLLPSDPQKATLKHQHINTKIVRMSLFLNFRNKLNVKTINIWCKW